MINIVEADLVTAVVTALTFGGNVGIGLGVGAGGGAISHWKKSSCHFRFFFLLVYKKFRETTSINYI